MDRIFPLHGISSQQKAQLAGAVKAFMEIVYKSKLNSIQLNSLEKLDHVIVGGNKNTSAIPKSIPSSVPNLSSMRSLLLFV